MSNETIGSLIRRYREDLKISQVMLANLCGLTPVAVCRLENGQTRPRIATIQRILTILKVKYNELVNAMQTSHYTLVQISEVTEHIYNVNLLFILQLIMDSKEEDALLINMLCNSIKRLSEKGKKDIANIIKNS